MLEETRENKPERDESGRLLPGNTANPNGRPKGSLSITAEIKKKLEEVPEGQKKTYLELLISRILKQAIQDGDNIMIGKIWNYVDGMPEQKTQLSGDEAKPIQVIIKRHEENRSEFFARKTVGVDGSSSFRQEVLVKFLFVKGRTSYQSHKHRDEWHFGLYKVKAGEKHRMQHGVFLELALGKPKESDIIRYEDDYGR